MRIRSCPPKAVILASATVVVIISVTWSATRPPLHSVRGALLDVRSSSIVQAEQITLRDEQGQGWTFRVAPEAMSNPEHPQSASHLRQHMVMAEPMMVYYRETREGLVAYRIVDAAMPLN